MHYLAIGLPGPTELIILLVIFFVVYALPSGVVAFVAWNYGRSPVAWFLLSMIVTPLFSIIALVAVGRIDSE